MIGDWINQRTPDMMSQQSNLNIKTYSESIMLQMEFTFPTPIFGRYYDRYYIFLTIISVVSDWIN